MQLSEVDDARKLDNNLLRELAELHALPPLTVDGGVEQLGDWIFRVFAAAVNDPGAEFHLSTGYSLPAAGFNM